MPFKKSGVKKFNLLFHRHSIGKNTKLAVGIVGCGTIGMELAQWLQRDLKQTAQVVVLHDRIFEKASELAKLLHPSPVSTNSLEELVQRSQLIIESASASAVPEIAQNTFKKGKDLMVMSTGGLLQNPALFTLARKQSSRIYIPSGAIGGVDAIKAAGLGGIECLSLTTWKSPESLASAPYWIKKNKSWESIKKETLLFEGDVLTAIQLFPQNINISAILQLAVPEFLNIVVRIYAVPQLRKNIHEIVIQAESGNMTFRMENEPAPMNPKTSYLAILSAKVLLKEITSSIIRVGS